MSSWRIPTSIVQPDGRTRGWPKIVKLVSSQSWTAPLEHDFWFSATTHCAAILPPPPLLPIATRTAFHFDIPAAWVTETRRSLRFNTRRHCEFTYRHEAVREPCCQSQLLKTMRALLRHCVLSTAAIAWHSQDFILPSVDSTDPTPVIIRMASMQVKI